jgi:TolB-like protein/class 3 adenylate cyclase/tetratricopeptide (TPR) repeat protein
MEKDRLSGKLAVILHADIAGSTALVQQNEQLAHERIQDAFRRFGDTIKIYQGHVLELRGDALLAEFERPSDAVSATLAFQADQAYYLSRLKDDLKPCIRVGIAMGEVVIADSTITGAGVVLAQRVEQLADPGGLCITAALHEALPKRMPFDLENLGEQEVKGFDDPVRVYRVELSANQSLPSPQQNLKSDTSRNKPGLMIATIVIALVVAGGATFWFKTQAPTEEAASIERMAFPLPDKPSIAVLPFTNMSNDAEQEFFADGMTEDLITDISKVSGLFVIARNSVFTYKGKAVKVRQVAEDLGVRYVMEGSVQRVGNKVRINAQLIDATTGGHIWADRYDGSMDDVFTMRDGITRKIVDALAVNLVGQEQSNLARHETTNPQAYDVFLRGWEHYRRTTPDDYTKAIAYFEQAIQLDPDYSRAHSALSLVYWGIASRGWIKSTRYSYSQAYDRARNSLKEAMRSPSALTHQVASEVAAYFQGSPDKALAEAANALALDVNDPAGHLAMATALMKSGKPDEAIESIRQAMRLDPHYPASYLTRLGRAQYDLGQYAEAAITLESSTRRNPQDDRAFLFLAAAYGHLNRTEEARSAVRSANTLRESNGWSKLNRADISYWKWVSDRKNLQQGLAKAGVEYGRDWAARVKVIESARNLYDVAGATKIGIEKAKQLYDRGAIFVDVGRLYSREHIPGSHSLVWWPYDWAFWYVPREFNEVRLQEIADKTQEIVIYSNTGQGSGANASAYAVENGFQKVYFFENGFSKWKAAGYPVDQGK